MTQAVTVYRWDDVGAPQITTGKPSEYLTVFKKCLVEGYGNKISLGWTVVEESTPEEPPYLAVRNNINAGGSGGTMTFESDLDDGPQRIIKEQSFLDFTSRNIKSRAGAYFGFYGNSPSTSSMLKNWVLIGTAKGFFFTASANSTMDRNHLGTFRNAFFYAGDINSVHTNDPATFITMSGQIDDLGTGWNNQLNYRLCDTHTSEVSKVYALDGSLLSEKGFAISLFGSNSVSNTNEESSVPDVRLIVPVILSCGSYSLGGSGSTFINNEILPFIRGYIPGLFMSQEWGYEAEPMFFIKNIDGQDYLSIPKAAHGGTNVWINLEEW